MAKAVAALVAGLAAIGTVVVWGQNASEYVYTTPKAEALAQEIREHHDEDTQLVFQLIADEKKTDRIQRNQSDLKRLERDLIGGRYGNADEKEFMILEIRDLQAAIHCDRDGICSQ